jgi:hypothetical protein
VEMQAKGKRKDKNRCKHKMQWKVKNNCDMGNAMMP